MTAAFNFFCADVDRQFAFYRDLLNRDEDEPARSPIYRALRADGLQLGFHARAAYGLLGIADRAPVAGAEPPVTAYPTFEFATPARVDSVAGRVEALGGGLVKGPFATYYGQWQAVLTDPERNVFRVAALSLPAGVEAAPKPF